MLTLRNQSSMLWFLWIVTPLQQGSKATLYSYFNQTREHDGSIWNARFVVTEQLSRRMRDSSIQTIEWYNALEIPVLVCFGPFDGGFGVLAIILIPGCIGVPVVQAVCEISTATLTRKYTCKFPSFVCESSPFWGAWLLSPTRSIVQLFWTYSKD